MKRSAVVLWWTEVVSGIIYEHWIHSMIDWLMMDLLDGSWRLRFRALPAGSNCSIFCAAVSEVVVWKGEYSSSSTSFCASVEAYLRHCAVHAALNGRSDSRSRLMKALVTACNAMAAAVMDSRARQLLRRDDARFCYLSRNTTSMKLAASRFYPSADTCVTWTFQTIDKGLDDDAAGER